MLFHEPSCGKGWNARPYRKGAEAVLSCLAPRLPAHLAQALADEALALAVGRPTLPGKLDNLIAGTDGFEVHDSVAQLDPQALWHHNHDLAAKLQLLLPPLPGSTPQQRVEELQVLLPRLPVAAQEELAEEWVPPVLRTCSSGPVEALCRLRPVPISLLLKARQLSYAASRMQHHAVTDVAEMLPLLRSDYLMLKALQRVVALHTKHYSIDRPAAGSTEVAAIRDRLFGRARAGQLFERDVDTALLSVTALQSTYPPEVLDATSEYLHGAVETVFQSGGPDGQRNSLGTPSDHLTVVWRCASCDVLPVPPPPSEARLPPFGPLCTCAGLQWAWSDLEPGGEAELERRAERRARWWVTQQGSPTKRPLVVLELLDLVQRAMLKACRARDKHNCYTAV
jgi:hypothetical protein